MELVNNTGTSYYCPAKPSSDNHPQPCCVAVLEDERTELIGDETFSGGFTYTGQNLSVRNTITLNGGTYIFNNCDVVFWPGAKILVKSGTILYIYGSSHLYACDRMWEGIEVENGGYVLIYGNSIIEDAEIAVDVKFGSYYYLNNATFNRNHIHVQKTMPSGTPVHTGDYRILRCKFLCQTTASIGGSPVHDVLLAPREDERTAVGVLAMGVPKILVGNTSPNANTFDNSDYGIFNWTVGRVEVLHNTLRDITAQGATAFFGPGNGGETIDISHNTILRTPFGINCHDNDTTVRTRITHNVIDYTGIADPSQYMTGITVSEITPGNGNQIGNFNYADITYNTITNAPNGIRIQNMRGRFHTTAYASLIVGHNTITQGQKTANDWQACINVEDCETTSIVGNHLSQHSGSPHHWYSGVRLSGGFDHSLQCDTLFNIGQGLFFDGDLRPYTTVANNVMETNHRGMFLNHAYVGQQGHGTRPSDNKWLGTGWSTGNPNTQVWGTGVDGSESEFFIRNVTPPSVYVPQFNEIASGAINPIATPTASSGTWGSCEFDLPSFKTDDSEPDGVAGLLAIIEGDGPETERGRSVRWMGEYNLYRAMQADADLQYADNALSTFYTGRDAGNMGRLHRAIDGFSAARNGEAQSASEGLGALQTVQPQNRVEQTLHDLLGILYANATDLRNMGSDHAGRMREIARRCPLDDGLAVYMARAALLNIDTLPRGYMNECEQVPTPEDSYGKQDTFSGEANGFAVYPNPNSGVITIGSEAEGELPGRLQLFDLTGRKVLSRSVMLNGSTTVNLDGVPSGLYVLRLDVEGRTALTERISVIRP